MGIVFKPFVVWQGERFRIVQVRPDPGDESSLIYCCERTDERDAMGAPIWAECVVETLLLYALARDWLRVSKLLEAAAGEKIRSGYEGAT